MTPCHRPRHGHCLHHLQPQPYPLPPKEPMHIRGSVVGDRCRKDTCTATPPGSTTCGAAPRTPTFVNHAYGLSRLPERYYGRRCQLCRPNCSGPTTNTVSQLPWSLPQPCSRRVASCVTPHHAEGSNNARHQAARAPLYTTPSAITPHTAIDAKPSTPTTTSSTVRSTFPCTFPLQSPTRVTAQPRAPPAAPLPAALGAPRLPPPPCRGCAWPRTA